MILKYGTADYNSDSVLKKILVMKYSPKILHKRIQSRPLSSFLYVIHGCYHYTCDRNDFYVESGDTIYLPKGGVYTYEVISQDTQVIQLELDLEEHMGAEVQSLIFSESPIPIYGHSHELHTLFEELYSTYYKDKLKTISLIYQLICICKDAFEEQNKNADFMKIAPAIQYIEKNVQSKIYIEDLAQIAGISQSHLRRLFQKCLGVSPVKYKNMILMKMACNMLLNEGLNVSETADALMFSDIYTFSQLFKKEIGVSPRKYMEENKKGH